MHSVAMVAGRAATRPVAKALSPKERMICGDQMPSV
jgi:hypothetical protein